MNKNLFVFFILTIASVVHADTLTWTGAGNDTNLSNVNNWESGTLPQSGDVLLFPIGSSFYNDLQNFSPSALIIYNHVSQTAFQGEPFVVSESGLDIKLYEGVDNLKTQKGFSGNGTITVRNLTGIPRSGIDIPPHTPQDFEFAGKWVLDRSFLETGMGVSSIGAENPDQVIPDAITLMHGASLKNYSTDLIIEPWMGTVLGEGGGGFCCGWKTSTTDYSIQLNGPISGEGPLLIASCWSPIYLNNTNNTYTGETKIGTYENIMSFEIGASDETRLLMGADYAIPRGNDVTVDGRSNAVLDLNGHTLELGTLRLINGGVLRNSSDVPVTIKVDTIVVGGKIEGPITVEYGQKELACSADNEIWEHGKYFTIGSGETNTLSGMGLGGISLKLDGGALTLPVQNGFAESAYDIYRLENDEKNITAYKNSAEMGSSSFSQLWKEYCGYYYQSFWNIPETARYSFAKNFDNAAALQIDRDLIIHNNVSTTIEQKKDYPLSAGWHEVRIWFSNSSANGGPGENWEDGLKWSAENQEIDAATGKGFSTDNGTFVFSPTLIRPLYVGPLGGTVTRIPEENFTGDIPDLFLFGGLIATEDNSNCTPLHVDGGVVIGFKGETIPVFDGALELPPNKKLTFQGRVWIRKIPSCDYTILPETEVFLDPDIYDQMKEQVISAGGIICWSSFNRPERPVDTPIQIPNGQEQRIIQSSTFAGDTPLLDNEKLIVENAFQIDEGATLLINANGHVRFTGSLSGSGTMKCSASGPAKTINMLGDNSSFSGVFDFNMPQEDFVHAFNPENFGTGIVRTSGGLTLILGSGDTTSMVYPQKYEINGKGWFDVLSDEISVAKLTLSPESRGLLVDGHTLSVKASAFEYPEGLTVNGTGTLKIEIDTLGPYQAPKFTGTGNLVFKGDDGIDLQAISSSFNGAIALEGNMTLQEGDQTLPDPVLWLDASNGSSCIMDGEGKGVVQWNDCRGGDHPYAYLNQNVRNDRKSGYKTANPPVLFHDNTLETGPVLDFGKYKSGCWYSFSEDIRMRTVIFVIGSQNGGGASFFSNSNDAKGIVRGGERLDGEVIAKDAMFTGYEYGNPLFKESANPIARINGYSVSPHHGLSGEYEIITIGLQQDQILDTLAKDSRRFTGGGQGDDAKRSGGMRYAEMLFYDRLLTESEMIAVEEYLKKKWMGACPPVGNTMDNPLEFSVEGSVVIDAQDSNSIKQLQVLKGSGTLVKSGEGLLQVIEAESFDGLIDWQDGSLRLGDTLPEPAFWADMSKADSFGTDENGRFYWRDRRWDGVTDYVVATQRWSVAPTVLESELGGSSILDFGGLSKTHDRGLQWNKKIGAKAVFMLIGSQNSGGTILGGGDNNNESPYNRGDFSAASSHIVSGYAQERVRHGLFRLDGKTIQYDTTGFSGGYQVLCSCPELPTTVGQFAHDRELDATKKRDGGQRLGEVLIFTNKLSTIQIQKIEKYLERKWLNGKPCRYDEMGEIKKMNLPSSGTMALNKKGNCSIGTLTGTADLVVDGDGTLNLGDVTSYTGTVSVCAGTLALESSVQQILNRSRFWVDAAKLESMTFSENSNEVVQWRDCRDNGIYARRSIDKFTTVGDVEYPNLNPFLRENELNGLPVLDFGEWQGNRFLKWSTNLRMIRSVFWVIGSQNGGGTLLGSTDINSRDFYRGGGGTDHGDWDLIEAQNPIWADQCSDPCGSVLNGKTRLNGLSVDGTQTGLSGEYDIVSIRTTGPTSASTFGLDRNRYYRNATGGQRLAEVIIFEEELSDAETEIVENYLAHKWNLPLENQISVEMKSNMGILLAPGASLALNAYGAYQIGSVGGIGKVTGKADVSLSNLAQISAKTAGDSLDFEGSLSLADGGTWTVDLEGNEVAPISVADHFNLIGGGIMTITGAPAIGDDPMLLLSAQQLQASLVEGWKVKADDPARYFELTREGNKLFLSSSKRGLLLLLK